MTNLGVKYEAANYQRMAEERRELRDRLDRAQVTIGQLSHQLVHQRALLERLEWAGTTCWGDGSEEASCPTCGGTQEEGHREAAQQIGPDGKPFDSKGCELAEELGRP
jgi:hypothetical protein